MEKIKPLLEVSDLGKIDLQKAKKEFHEHFDELLRTREELFENKLSKGLENHKKFLKANFTTK